jgi:hypothetical protein
MLKIKGAMKIGFMVGLITLITSPAFARSISMKEGGTALWIFLIIGVVIILLQLIPAGILLSCMIATGFSSLRKSEVPVHVS